MFLSGKLKFVPIVNTADFNAGATGDSINIAKVHRVTFVLMFGAITGGAAALTVKSGVSDGTQTTAATFKYALAGAATGSASADVLGDASTSSSLDLTAATYQNKMLLVEVDCAEVNTSLNHDWLTLALDGTADSGLLECVAIIEPRYSDMATVLA